MVPVWLYVAVVWGCIAFGYMLAFFLAVGTHLHYRIRESVDDKVQDIRKKQIQ